MKLIIILIIAYLAYRYFSKKKSTKAMAAMAIKFIKVQATAVQAAFSLVGEEVLAANASRRKLS
ncbi:hypothetical protein OH784_02160 [Ectobacillus funiculus]|uniref:hypothetical protein n=1 Tax=Ectobacillus funiculus TaxID=137993 RepID=UPI00397A6EC3